MTTPKPLMELCHDALAEGVLARHDGELPKSWIKMFKANKAAWAQLKEAMVAAPVYHEKDRFFTDEKHIHVVVAHWVPNEEVGSTITTACIKSASMPPWFEFLLTAWVEANRINPIEYNIHRPKGCLGGYKLEFNGPYDVSYLYWTIVELAENLGDVVDLCHDLTAALIHEFSIDLSHDLHDAFRKMNLLRSGRGEVTLDFSVMSTLDRVKLFPARCHRLVGTAILAQIIEVDDLQEEDLLNRLEVFGIKHVCKELVPSPIMTLCFTYNNETNPYWTGEEVNE